jgi:arabinofuranosyltransferase
MVRDKKALLVVLAAAICGLLIHAWLYLPFIADDTLISLRYSERLLMGKGLTWNDGERVEGYSNLLYVLLCALLGRVGLDLVLASRLLGLACAGAAVAAVVTAYRPARWADSAPAVMAAAVLVLSGPLAVWAVGGLEQPLLLALVTWAIVVALPLVERFSAARALGAGCLFGLACLTRPDGALFVVAACAGLWLESRDRRVLVLALVPAACVAGQLAFRHAYYGEWVPNTARIKASLSWFRLAQGAIYAAGCLYTVLPLLFLAKARTYFLSFIVVWSVYVTAVGGDIFPASRHLVPLLGPLALMVGGVFVASPRVARLLERRVGYCIAAYVFTQAINPRQWRALLERWEWDGKAIATMLGRAFVREQPLIAVETGGSIPFWSRLPAIDMLGLNDAYIAHHPPPDAGRTAKPGHDFGDGRYVYGRSPDLVLLGRPDGSDPEGECRSGVELVALPEFRREYSLVKFQPTPSLTSLIWIKKESPRIGIQRRANTITVPAYLLTGNAASVASMDGTGVLTVRVSPERAASVRDLQLGPRGWSLHVEANGPVESVVHHAGELADVELLSREPVDVRALVFSATD